MSWARSGFALLWWQQRQCVKGGQVSCFVGPLHVSSRCLGDEVHRPAQQIPPAKRITGQVYEICALPWKPCFQSSIWPYLDQSNAIEMLTVWGLGRPRFALNNFHIYRASRVLHRGKRPRRAELYFWIQTLCSPSRVYSCNTCIAFCFKKGYKINLRTTYDHWHPTLEDQPIKQVVSNPWCGPIYMPWNSHGCHCSGETRSTNIAGWKMDPVDVFPIQHGDRGLIVLHLCQIQNSRKASAWGNITS